MATEVDSPESSDSESQEVSIGVFTFEYDPKLRELYISRGEEVKAMVESVDVEDWRSFLADLN